MGWAFRRISNKKADGTNVSARIVAPAIPPVMAIVIGGQKPPLLRISGVNPAMVVTVVASTWRVFSTTTFVTAVRSP